jgi:hypothetical protein
MAKTVKISKMASNDNPHPTVLGSEGSIHINLHKEVLTGFEEGMKVFKGTYYCQVKLVQATELDLAVAQEQVKALETKKERVNLKLQVAVADSERWKRKYSGMMDRSYGSVESITGILAGIPSKSQPHRLNGQLQQGSCLHQRRPVVIILTNSYSLITFM